MVEDVEYKVSVDRQGRLVIPAPLRRRLGLSNGGMVVLRVRGDKVVIEVVDEDLDERIGRWRALVLSVRAELMCEEISESWKWMSVEYAKRKLGL